MEERLDFETKYQKLKEMGVEDNVILDSAKANGYNMDIVNSVITQYNQQTNTPQPVEPVETTQPTQPVEPVNDDPYAGLSEAGLSQQMALEQNALNEPDPYQNRGEYSISQHPEPVEQPNTNYFTDFSFLAKNDSTYEQVLDYLVNNKNNTTQLFSDLRGDLFNEALNSGYSDEEATQLAKDATDRFMKNFEISRYIQNNMYNEDTNRTTKLFTSLKVKFDLSDEEAKYWKEKWKEVSPTASDSIKKAFNNFKVGVEQDINGAISLFAKLTGQENSQFAKDAEAKIQELDKQATRINVERGHSFGAEDLSPVMLGEVAVGSLLAISSLPASVALAGTSALGALSGATYAKGQGESDDSVALSAGIGAGLPIAIPAVSKAFRKVADSLKGFLNQNGVLEKDLAVKFQDIPIENIMQAKHFLESKGGIVTDAGIQTKGTPSYNNAQIARTLHVFLKNSSAEDRAVLLNPQALRKGMQETLSNLAQYEGRLAKEGGETISDDQVAKMLVENIQNHYNKISNELALKYKNIEAVSADVFYKDANSILKIFNDFDKTITKGLDNDTIDLKKNIVRDKISQLEDRALEKGGLTLKDIREFSQSIKSDFASNDRISKQIVEVLHNKINQAQELMIDESLDQLTTKASSVALNKAEDKMRNQLSTLKEQIQEANALYQVKLKNYERAEIKNLLDKTSNSPELVDMVDDLVKKRNIAQLNNLKSMFSYVEKDADFDALGQRYLFNVLKKGLSKNDTGFNYSVSKEIQTLLQDKNLLVLFNIPTKQQKDLKILADAVDIAKNMEDFLSKRVLSQNTNFGTMGYMVTHIPDLIRNLLTAKVYTGKDFDKLVKKAKEIKVRTPQMIKELESKKFKNSILRSNLGASYYSYKKEGQE